MTDILLDITNQEMQYIAKEVYQYEKSKLIFYLETFVFSKLAIIT